MGLYVQKTWLYAPVRGSTCPFVPCLAPWTFVHVPVRTRFGLCARETWWYAPTRVCTSPFVSVWVCTPPKSGFTPPNEYARARSSPLGPVPPENLAVLPCTYVTVPVRARVVLYAWDTWLNATAREYAWPLVLLWACKPREPGFTPSNEYARIRSCPFGPVRRKNRAVRPLGRVCARPFEPVWARTPGKIVCTPLGEYARARLCPFGPVRPENLTERPWTCVHVPAWACTPGKFGCTPLHVCAHPRSCQFGVVRPQNLALHPLTRRHVPARARLGLYARKTLRYVPWRL